ncbi:Uncharacterised protein [Vibrio cholerae]|nr:Uncharacterised protein [Vibrio cholerae]
MPGWVFTANSPAGIVMRPITSGTLSSNHQLDLSRSCQRLAVIAKSGTKTTSRKTGKIRCATSGNSRFDPIAKPAIMA